METLGKELKKGALKRSGELLEEFLAQEEKIVKAVEEVKNHGRTTEQINARGQMTIWQRLEYLVDEGTWCPLHTLFNPEDNKEGQTNVVDGIGKINGKWAVIIGFDNKVMAGAWLPGQSENILRITDLAKRLNVPLVWLVNCSGAKLAEQEKFYANRRGSGAPFFRHADLNNSGVPILAGIYGTNPAGGGYQGISPTILFAHKKANIAVGGAGIVGGMAPKGYFDEEVAEELIENTRNLKVSPPGTVATHYDETGFFRYVYDEEQGVLDGIKDYMKDMPAYNPKFFRVDEPKEPLFAPEEIARVLPMNPKSVYDFEQVLARLVDGSEHTEFKPEFGKEVYCGIAKVDGFPVGVIGNRQGFLGMDYPEYRDEPGMGGKLYRQGLIKMSEFVTLCDRDKLPIIWLQDTTGIDVGEPAEKAELLGLGQSLIYSIQKSDMPMMLAVLRKGTAAAHYVMGGPQANDNNAFTVGTAATEIMVMHGETAASANFSRRLVKEKDAGNSIEPVIEKMNQMAKDYHEKSRPEYCAKVGYVDEISRACDLRNYMKAFVGSVYQNPKSICPQHQMILPRIIKG